MSTKEKVLKLGLPLLIILAGFIGMIFLSSLRQPPHKRHLEDTGVLVEVLPVHRMDHRATVFATGTVQAARTASIVPQVNGRITWMSPRLVAGGVFKKGEMLLEIEKADYEFAVEQARATLAKAELDLETVKGQAEVARAEWERLSAKNGRKPTPLLLYEPQIKNARAAVASARAALEQAELNLQRTRMFAPFNCAVQSEDIETGQYVRSGNPVATVIGTDKAEILTPVPMEDLQWIDVPASTRRGAASQASVFINVGDRRFRWPGRVDRLLKDVDPLGRMPRLIVSVSDPCQLLKREPARPDLLPGLFVDVEIKGRLIHQAFSVPASAIREGNTVWVADHKNRLHIQPVTIVRRERENVFIKSDLKEGASIILTKISGAAEGLRLKPVNREHGS